MEDLADAKARCAGEDSQRIAAYTASRHDRLPWSNRASFVGRERSLASLEASLRSNRLVVLLTQRDSQMQDPGPDNMYTVGCVASIIQELRLPDGTSKGAGRRHRTGENRRVSPG